MHRYWRALRLDAAVFREVRDDPRAIGAGAGLVTLGGLARGVGDWRSGGAAGLLASTALALLLWFLASFAVAALSAYFSKQRVSVAVILRTCAYAAAPIPLLALGIVSLPGLIEAGIWVAVHGAILAAFVVAVREALATDTTRALTLSAATLIFGFLVLFLLGVLFARPTAL